jgi:hypothetical protein
MLPSIDKKWMSYEERPRCRVLRRYLLILSGIFQRL